jgi:hypothetical protein
MKAIEQVKEERENIIIEEKLWDVFKLYPKLSVARTIYILAGMVKYLAGKL